MPVQRSRHPQCLTCQGGTPTHLPMPTALPTPCQKCPTPERGKHLRLQRDLILGLGRGQEAEEPEHHPWNSPGPHPPHAYHQQGDRPAGCGGSPTFLLPLGGSHVAPAMLPGWETCFCGAEPRSGLSCLCPRNVPSAARYCKGLRHRAGGQKPTGNPRCRAPVGVVCLCAPSSGAGRELCAGSCGGYVIPRQPLNPLAKQQQQQI